MATIDSLFAPLMRTSFTKNDLRRRINLLRSYLEATYFTDQQIGIEDWIARQHVDDLDAQVMLSWGKQFYLSFTKDEVYTAITAFTEKVATLPILTMYLPFSPNAKDIASIGLWCRKNINNACILDLRTDPSLIAGCAIGWNGRYFEYSLHFFVDQTREEIKKLISSFTKEEPPAPVAAPVPSAPTIPPVTAAGVL